MNTQQFTVSLLTVSSLFISLPALAQSPSVNLFPSYPTESPADKVRNIQVSADLVQQPARKPDDFNQITKSIQISRNKSSDSVQPSEIFTSSDDQPFKFKAPIQRF